jgi:hypothetical protein
VQNEATIAKLLSFSFAWCGHTRLPARAFLPNTVGLVTGEKGAPYVEENPGTLCKKIKLQRPDFE